MSIKVSQYLVTKTPAQSSHQDTEGEILGILRIIFHNIFNSDWGSSTKKIKKIFSRICVFIFQILLVGWSSEFCERSLTYICIISEQSLEIKHIPFPHVAPAFLSSSCQTTHNCKDESTEKWRKVSEFLVSGYEDGDTPHGECDIIDCPASWLFGMLEFSFMLVIINLLKSFFSPLQFPWLVEWDPWWGKQIFNNIPLWYLPDIFPQFFDENNQYL